MKNIGNMVAESRGCAPRPTPPRPAKTQVLPLPALQKLANPAGRGGQS